MFANLSHGNDIICMIRYLIFERDISWIITHSEMSSALWGGIRGISKKMAPQASLISSVDWGSVFYRPLYPSILLRWPYMYLSICFGVCVYCTGPWSIFSWIKCFPKSARQNRSLSEMSRLSCAIVFSDSTSCHGLCPVLFLFHPTLYIYTRWQQMLIRYDMTVDFRIWCKSYSI